MLLRRWVRIVTHDVLIVEIERTVVSHNAFIYVTICHLANGRLIEVVNEGGIVKLRLNIIMSVGVINHWLFFITLSV